MITVKQFCDINNIASVNRNFITAGLKYIPTNKYYFTSLHNLQLAIDNNDFESYSSDSGVIRAYTSNEYRYVYVELLDDYTNTEDISFYSDIIFNLNKHTMQNDFITYFDGSVCMFNGEFNCNVDVTDEQKMYINIRYKKEPSADYVMLSSMTFNFYISETSTISASSAGMLINSHTSNVCNCNINTDSYCVSDKSFYPIYFTLAKSISVLDTSIITNMDKNHGCRNIVTQYGNVYIENCISKLLQNIEYDKGYEVDDNNSIKCPSWFAGQITGDNVVILNSTFEQYGGCVHGHKNGSVYTANSFGDKSGYGLNVKGNVTLVGCKVVGMSGGLSNGGTNNTYITGGHLYGYSHGGIYDSGISKTVMRDCTIQGAAPKSVGYNYCRKYGTSNILVGASGTCYLGYASTTYMDNVKSNGTYLSTNVRGIPEATYGCNAKMYLSNFYNEDTTGRIRIDGNNLKQSYPQDTTDKNSAAVICRFGNNVKNIKNILSGGSSHLGYIRLVDEDGTEHSIDEYIFSEPFYNDFYTTADESHRQWIADRKSKYDLELKSYDFDKVFFQDSLTAPKISPVCDVPKSLTEYIENRGGISYREDPRDILDTYNSIPKNYDLLVTSIRNIKNKLYNKLKDIGYDGRPTTVLNMLNWYNTIHTGSNVEVPTLDNRVTMLDDFRNFKKLNNYLREILKKVDTVSVNDMDTFNILIDKIK